MSRNAHGSVVRADGSACRDSLCFGSVYSVLLSLCVSVSLSGRLSLSLSGRECFVRLDERSCGCYQAKKRSGRYH